jgi:hypothetical protein
VRNADRWSRVCGNAVAFLFRAAQSAVAGHGSVGAVKCRRSQRVVCPARPVIIGLISLISTFIAQCLLIGPSEVTVPSKEVASVVNLELSAKFSDAIMSLNILQKFG